MRTLSLLSVLLLAVCVVGCEDSELVTCQQEKQILQTEVEEANTAIAAKDNEIKKLEEESVDMQTKAMESIQVILNKHAEQDEKFKAQIEELEGQNEIKQGRIAELEIENKNLQGLCDQTKASLDIANEERQQLITKLNEIQKEASR